MKKLLRASPYFFEDALRLRLDERAAEGKITFVLLNQPPVCDAHCRRCFMPEYRRKDIVNTLTLDESKYVIDQAKNVGALALEISGEGEPLLSKNLSSIVEYAANSGLLVTVITNGHSLNEDNIRYFMDHSVTLVISLHTLNEKKYENDNRVPGSFGETAANTYRNSDETVNGYEVFRLAIHATLQRDNYDEIESMKTFCSDYGLFFSVAPLALVGCAVEHPEIVPMEAMPSIEELAEIGDNSIILSHSTKRDIGREVCGTCFYGLNIGYDGSLLFDAHAGYEVGDSLGNIRTTPFSELLKRQSILVKELFSNIKGFCPVRDPKWADFITKRIPVEALS